MSQPYEHTLSRCPKCHAGPEEECRNNSGRVADKVHYGRPAWSRKTRLYREWKLSKAFPAFPDELL
jgi:hypothetical protein